MYFHSIATPCQLVLELDTVFILLSIPARLQGFLKNAHLQAIISLGKKHKSCLYFLAHFLIGEPNSLGGQSTERGGYLSTV